MVSEPYTAYYGQVEATELAEWWKSHRSNLFDRNIRKFIVDSEVNVALATTLESEPEHFWYFNNGITVLCDQVVRAPVGGASRRTGKFELRGATVVNGAQTVGTIGRFAERDPAAVSNARVQVRFISLEASSNRFDALVTRATNTQNRVERRDFVARCSRP
ncbi:MAG: AIPR family protein [Leucobacter sp.]